MGKLVELILDKYDGSLKAEHGTGLNMAPYVEREWGAKATELMWRVKALADPDGVLAPGVLLNRDPGAHLRNLKTTPQIEEVATTCVECGFCEPVCPSRHLTLTPRQRIVVRREMARQPEGSPVQRALLEQYEYDGIETCAADGSCALACPLGDRHRQAGQGPPRRPSTGAGRAPGARTGAPLAAASSARPARACAPAGRSAALPGRAGRGRCGRCQRRARPGLPRRDAACRLRPGCPRRSREGAAAVYMPACVNRIFGRPRGAPRGPALPEAMVEVSARAGLPRLDPRRRRRPLLRRPLELEGLPARATS